MNQLIDTHAFFSKKSGQVYPVEKAYDTGDKAGCGQKQGTCYQGVMSGEFLGWCEGVFHKTSFQV